MPKIVAGEKDPVRKIDLATALQYGTAEGYPPLLSFIRQFTRDHLHPSVPYLGGPEVVLTCGSTDGFSKTLDLLIDPWSETADDMRDRPGMLCEPFIYASILTQVQPRGVQVVTVETDEHGMAAHGPGGLEDVLANWDYEKGKRPSFMYTVTFVPPQLFPETWHSNSQQLTSSNHHSLGHNPTGLVLSVERKKELYAVCSKYDVIIVEDEPYWYLQFPSAAIEEARSRGQEPPPPPQEGGQAAGYKPPVSSGYEFLDSLTPSFLSVDTDGRVIHLDTFSKTIAPGCRLGWITAQPNIIDKLIRYASASSHPHPHSLPPFSSPLHTQSVSHPN